SVSYNALRAVQAQNGEKMAFPSVPDEAAPLGQLSVFLAPDPAAKPNPNLPPNAAKTSFKPDGTSALVDESGKILIVGAAPMIAALPMPIGARVLTGAGAAGAWIAANLRVGETVKFSASPSLQKMADAPWEKVGLFVSPHNPEVRAYQISIAREIAGNYAVDGVVFDRMRFSGLGTDFSDLARAEFEKTLGKRVENWPADVLSYADDPFAPVIQGPLYKQWLEFRAATIQSFTREAAREVRAARRGVQVGVYVGSWYSDYYAVGVNWAANDFNAAYEWMTPEYFRTGYAQELDWISTGCYYPVSTRADALAQGFDPQATVESAAALSNAVVNDVAWVYGAVYLENYNDKPDDFARAIEVCKQATQGVMIFDAVHLDQRGWWPVLERALSQDALAPDQVPGLLAGVRSTAGALKTSRGNGGVTLGAMTQVPISQTP
ncbi:MAG: family 10 glycosylhydrolase, partial [Armatimonadetes bacterium]|nr:family 10 glycosylhydrolase [Armatimonadota bacterium]